MGCCIIGAAAGAWAVGWAAVAAGAAAAGFASPSLAFRSERSRVLFFCFWSNFPSNGYGRWEAIDFTGSYSMILYSIKYLGVNAISEHRQSIWRRIRCQASLALCDAQG